MRVSEGCASASRLPPTIVAMASATPTACAGAEPPNDSPSTRNNAANAAALTPVAMKPETGVGAPSYTSGAHMWNGTAAILNANPTSSSPSPSSSIVGCAPPSRDTCSPINLRLGVAGGPSDATVPHHTAGDAEAHHPTTSLSGFAH